MNIIFPAALCMALCATSARAQHANDTIAGMLLLHAVTVEGDAAQQKLQSQAVITVDREYMSAHRSHSLMGSLERLPGVKAWHIGQGFSKPIIRGLGFNRVAVVERGVKQQGQQWGADHGLEIDQYNVESVRLVMGPVSLQYGSDAIAGVVVIDPQALTAHDGLSGSALLTGSSNNRLLGGSAGVRYQKGNSYLAGRATYRNFEDYRVPAHDFQYLNWTFPIHDGILKNTAGREFDVALQAGRSTKTCSSSIAVSNVHAKTGFFAGAHGLPTAIALDDDGDYRNIGLPYQEVNHFKAVYNQTVWLTGTQKVSGDFGFQHNLRKEYSLPHTHGYGPVPEGNLELALRLQTVAMNVAWEGFASAGHTLSAGISAEYQHHRIGGYSFLLPQFEQMTYGAFVTGRYYFSRKLAATAGLRYDAGHIHIHRYLDAYLPEAYRQRSPALRKAQGDATFGVGLDAHPHPQWKIKVNVGKSFRMPTASEYASNGIHHGMFRHELGDSTLRPERAYQLDCHLAFSRESDGFITQVSWAASGFASYFPNFIFLNPTGAFSWLPDAGQYYRYEQSRAFRAGGELQLHVDFAKRFCLESSAEYVYAVDLDSRFPLPFTPPLQLTSELSAGLPETTLLGRARLSVTHRYAAAQHRVSRNEASTPGYHLFEAAVSSIFSMGKRKDGVKIMLQVQNLFHARYYNHISFYRYLNVPEPGRTLLLSLEILL
jgi:iron complex outermembrane receptor protein